jgi:hypothetical protein
MPTQVCTISGDDFEGTTPLAPLVAAHQEARRETIIPWFSHLCCFKLNTN